MGPTEVTSGHLAQVKILPAHRTIYPSVRYWVYRFTVGPISGPVCSASQSRNCMSQKPFLRGLSIVLACDAPFERWVVPGILRSSGANRIHIVRTEAELQDLLSHTEVDALIVDDQIDDGRGIDVVHDLRHSDDGHNCFLPIVYLLGQATRGRVMTAALSGVHEVVTKPYSAKTMLDRLYWTITKPRPFMRQGNYFGPEPRKLSLTPQRTRPSVDQTSASDCEMIELDDEDDDDLPMAIGA
jgi:two-component system chemotaxis response regulator CheY